jgi:hypothetical protein
MFIYTYIPFVGYILVDFCNGTVQNLTAAYDVCSCMYALCVCICILCMYTLCTCVCMHTYTAAYDRVFMYVCIMYMHTCMYVWMCICMCVRMHLCSSLTAACGMYACTPSCRTLTLHICTYMQCVCVCMHILFLHTQDSHTTHAHAYTRITHNTYAHIQTTWLISVCVCVHVIYSVYALVAEPWTDYVCMHLCVCVCIRYRATPTNFSTIHMQTHIPVHSFTYICTQSHLIWLLRQSGTL